MAKYVFMTPEEAWDTRVTYRQEYYRQHIASYSGDRMEQITIIKKIMSNKYDIYHESGWLDNSQSPSYEKITTVKNERAAIDFATNIENISRYGDMLIRMKSGGSVWTYNDRNGEWER